MKGIDIIPQHKTHDITDSSKLQSYMMCPRKFFYRYILGWTSETPNIHLIFGESWHRALRVLYENYGNNSPEVVWEAVKAAEEYYREFFPPEYDESNAPKNLLSIIHGLTDYMMRYKDDDFEILHIETAGSVSVGLNKDRMITFRVDTIVKDPVKGIISLEHKTGSYLSNTWTNSWILKTQIGTYTHVLNMMYDYEEVYGVIVNATMFYKGRKGSDGRREFVRVPSRKTLKMMEVWINIVNSYMDRMESDYEQLMETDVDDPVMNAYQMNTEACTMYNRTCMYHNICTTQPNPLCIAQETPFGFKKEYWDPTVYEKSADNVVKL